MSRTLKLSESIINSLINTPETGMGYHDVLVTLKNGQELERQVINSEILILAKEDSFSLEDIIKIKS